MKNRIINGDMRIDQRNAGAAVNNANSYTLDRWYFMQGQASATVAFNLQQSSTAPANFSNSLGITVGTAANPGASNYSCLYQRIEGYNTADFNWGSASATPITLSFWVYSSVTGTFGVAIQNSANTRSYVGTYTINSANTWEYETITIPGDTAGTWLKTNGAGMLIHWDMGVGTGQSTTAGTWQAGNYLGLTGGTKLSVTSAATFYITGVQVEKGTTATAFDYRSYGTELHLCQRYCYFVGSYTSGYNLTGNMGSAGTTTEFDCVFPFPVIMRTAPSLSAYPGSNWRIYEFYGAPVLTGTGTLGASTPISAYVYWVSTGLTQFRPYALQTNNSVAGLIFSAEL
jgi:hypothetical protein